MLRIGFLTELVDAQDLNAKVQSYLGSLRECETAVVRSMKAHIDRLAATACEDPLGRIEYERSLQSESLRARLSAMR
jgi:hypothetical protein